MRTLRNRNQVKTGVLYKFVSKRVVFDMKYKYLTDELKFEKKYFQ